MLDPYNNTLPKDSVRNFQSLDGRADVVDADDVGVRDAGDAGARRRRISQRSVGLAREVAEEPFSRCSNQYRQIAQVSLEFSQIPQQSYVVLRIFREADPRIDDNTPRTYTSFKCRINTLLQFNRDLGHDVLVRR